MLSKKAVSFHHLNPTFFLPRAALIEPSATAVVHRTRSGHNVEYTYKQHADRVQYLAHYFKSKGYKRVAILGPNTPAHLETMYAATAAGGMVLGLNYRLKEDEIHYKLDLGKADVVIADAEFQHLIDDPKVRSVRDIIVDQDDVSSSIVSGSKIAIPGSITGSANGISCDYINALQSGKQISSKFGDSGWEQLHAEDVDEDSLLGLFFTSGTTGRPKAVEYTHRGTYLAAVANIIEAQLNCQDILGNHRCHYLWTLPMFHAAGWTYPYAVTAVRGTHFCLRKIDVDYIWDLFMNRGITHMNAAPTVNTMLLNSSKAQRIPQPVKVVVAASPPSGRLFEEMMAHNLFPVHMYGLTETYGPFTRAYFNEEWKSRPKEEHYTLLARQGFSFLTAGNARVVDEHLNDVPKDGKTIGEIVVRGNIVTKGYHDDEAETNKAFNEWFKSGDLAVMHEDGSLQVLDRKKDIIISGGENISSVAVESAIVRYPNVLETSVVGVPHDLYGEVPYAYITLKDPTQSFDKEGLVLWLKERIGGYQVPKHVEVVELLPKTSTGKVRKNVLRDRARETVVSQLVDVKAADTFERVV